MTESFAQILFFPLRRLGAVAFLAAGTAVVTFCECLGPLRGRDARVYLLPIAATLIARYLYRVLEETVTGSDAPPGIAPEDWDDAWEDLVHYLGGLLVAFLPVWILLVYALFEQKGHLHRKEFQTALGVCLLLGTAYLPMALLLNGFTQRFATAFNFGVGFRGIRIMGADYALCSVLFLAGYASWLLLQYCWVSTTPPGFNGARASAAAVTTVVGLYLGVLQMRALGKAYRRHHDALGWSLGSEA